MAEERTLGSPSIEEGLARGVRVRRTGRQRRGNPEWFPETKEVEN